MEKVSLDDLDRQLIQLLMNNAARTNVALARELGVSDVTVRNRTQRLLDAGVVQIVAVVDPQKVGRHIQIICGVEVELDKAHEVAQALAAMAETNYVGYTSGQYDLVFVAALASEDKLFEYLTRRIPAIGGIRRIQTNQVLRVLKHTHHYEQVADLEHEVKPAR